MNSQTSKSFRAKKIIEPRLQLKFVGAFATVAAIAIICQSTITAYLVSSMAKKAPSDMSFILESVPELLGKSILMTTAVLIPMSIVVGVMMTFPIVGPLYNLRKFLEAVRAGERIAPCVVRKGDELQDFCDLINDVTEQQRLDVQQAQPEATNTASRTDTSAKVA